jgi:flagellar basal-body rod protein FlgF
MRHGQPRISFAGQTGAASQGCAQGAVAYPAHAAKGIDATVQNNFYVALSAQKALMRRIDTIANNVANVSTGGFRAEEVTFETALSDMNKDPVAFASTGTSYISKRPGEIVRTDNPLDVAVQGDAWLAVQTPAGTVYTRDGRMTISAQGELQSVNGYPILDVSGSPLRLEPDAGPPQIGRDGTIAQGKRSVGRIGLFTIDPKAGLTRFQGAGVQPDRPATPAVESAKYGVQQGFVERSNVNPVTEMAKMIMVQRTFDAVTSSLKDAEGSQTEAVRNLAATS